MPVQREQPYGGQHFLVDLGDGVMEGPDAAFWAISGLETWIEAPKYRTGNESRFKPGKPGRTRAYRGGDSQARNHRFA